MITSLLSSRGSLALVAFLLILSLVVIIYSGDVVANEYLLKTILVLLIAELGLISGLNNVLISTVIFTLALSLYVLSINVYLSVLSLIASIITIRLSAKTMPRTSITYLLIGVISSFYIATTWLTHQNPFYVYLTFTLIISIPIVDSLLKPLIHATYMSQIARYIDQRQGLTASMVRSIRRLPAIRLVAARYAISIKSALAITTAKLISYLTTIRTMKIDNYFLVFFNGFLARIKKIEDDASALFHKIAFIVDELQYDIEEASFYILLLMNILMIMSLLLYALYIAK